jgi:hypothetical protein
MSRKIPDKPLHEAHRDNIREMEEAILPGTPSLHGDSPFTEKGPSYPVPKPQVTSKNIKK